MDWAATYMGCSVRPSNHSGIAISTAAHLLDRTAGLALIAAFFLPGCLSDPDTSPDPTGEAAHLSARPGAPSDPQPNGRYELNLAGGRDGWYYIPPGLDPAQPAPLLVTLHGAGGNARSFDGAIKYADSLGMVVMAPDSRNVTWDVVGGSFGPDVAFIDAALQVVFSEVAIDPDRMALSGFSDGASYALSLGLSNGDLFSHLIAWSPGFIRQSTLRGSPEIYVSHGVRDGILPIDLTSRRLVPQLRGGGYDVVYEEFDGAHEITPEIARSSFGWFLDVEVPPVDP